MKLSIRLFKMLLKLTVFLALPFTFSVHASANEFLDRFYQAVPGEGYFMGNDTVYQYGAYLLIQNYGDDDNQRLPISALNMGDWIIVSYELDRETGARFASKVMIMPDEKTADEVYRTIELK